MVYPGPDFHCIVVFHLWFGIGGGGGGGVGREGQIKSHKKATNLLRGSSRQEPLTSLQLQYYGLCNGIFTDQAIFRRLLKKDLACTSDQSLSHE